MCNITTIYFFQAEDGIRDIGVTGVQTCALPISARVGKLGSPPSCSALGPSPHSGGRPPEWAKVAARRAAQPWGPTPTQAADRQRGSKWQPAVLLSPGAPAPLRRPTARVGQSGSPPRCSALGPSPHSGGRPPEWVEEAGRLAAQSWGPQPHSGGRRPEWVKVAAHPAAQPSGPHPHSCGRPPEWVIVAEIGRAHV